ncbi:hypothetical protein [Bradyrhizobium genosp. P]|uniref:hypothetical protein n=1 Tax=Bradyrhizobium genosp. P TaxID=83641 RepID=UPI003CEF74DA
MKQRLARSNLNPIGKDVLHIDNSGSLNVAGERFIDALRAYRQASGIMSSPH